MDPSPAPRFEERRTEELFRGPTRHRGPGWVAWLVALGGGAMCLFGLERMSQSISPSIDPNLAPIDVYGPTPHAPGNSSGIVELLVALFLLLVPVYILWSWNRSRADERWRKHWLRLPAEWSFTPVAPPVLAANRREAIRPRAILAPFGGREFVWIAILTGIFGMTSATVILLSVLILLRQAWY